MSIVMQMWPVKKCGQQFPVNVACGEYRQAERQELTFFMRKARICLRSSIRRASSRSRSDFESLQVERKLFAPRSSLEMDRVCEVAGARHFSFNTTVFLVLELGPEAGGEEAFVRLIDGRT